MANPEHLAILEQGVDFWNQWRRENPTDYPDLSGANLAERDLPGIKLSLAYLADTNLSGARLSRANLNGANAPRAHFTGAVLWSAHLVSASLGGARFDDARLNHTLFSSNYLGDADFAGAQLSNCIFASTDVSPAEGLERVLHHTSSAVSTQCLVYSAMGIASAPERQGPVESFFRGCGLDEHAIAYFRSLIGKPIEFYSCFISYSHTEKTFARRLHDQLQGKGIRCWLDEKDIKPGQRIHDVVDRAIRLHDRLILCCSESSLKSWWVRDEIRKAQEKEREQGRDIIIPLNLDDYLFEWKDGMASDLRSRLAADFTGWESDNAKFEEQFERVVEALKPEREE